MIILTDCLGNAADEGGMKVCSSLTKRLKIADPSVTVVSYGEMAGACDLHIPANKFLLSWRLFRLLRQKKEPVLYLPSYARTLPLAGRILMLTLLAGRRVRALIVMRAPIKKLSALLLKMSGAEILCLSEESAEAFRQEAGISARQLKTGVDTQCFKPVSAEKKAQLRRKYGLPEDRHIVLHVGHMKEGRNIGAMGKLDERFHGVLVVSTLTAAFEDKMLRNSLEGKKNLTILDQYLPHIEEMYQLADVYLFPVEKRRHCIDVPLSALEAAACSIPVVATEYGELKTLLGRAGFTRIESFDAQKLNDQLEAAICKGGDPRPHVLPYDWQHTVKELLD